MTPYAPALMLRGIAFGPVSSSASPAIQTGAGSARRRASRRRRSSRLPASRPRTGGGLICPEEVKSGHYQLPAVARELLGPEVAHRPRRLDRLGVAALRVE